jgi:hypothetical protein
MTPAAAAESGRHESQALGREFWAAFVAIGNGTAFETAFKATSMFA